ncbi:unnamed protein product [Vitrella brassicaformis CCMP3155]|uniref:Uncharacterized protein n=1 Tax=Vitrella brassicaformis (strain CCMP3155) TaxID=1169540 RepID=A0A0G4GQK0_VITBC|nr:unnamed protein product [Vitrella brassicaformis CCMP3155]|eukprot:CEM32728.1 unnamed protein product [Vitrella brassicaformis CCMP3155]
MKLSISVHVLLCLLLLACECSSLTPKSPRSQLRTRERLAKGIRNLQDKKGIWTPFYYPLYGLSGQKKIPLENERRTDFYLEHSDEDPFPPREVNVRRIAFEDDTPSLPSKVGVGEPFLTHPIDFNKPGPFRMLYLKKYYRYPKLFK